MQAEVELKRKKVSHYTRKNVNMKKKSKSHFLNWYDYSRGYLRLAHLGLLELKQQKYRNEFNQFTQSDIYDDNIILIPIIWCLKHSIELVLKSFNVRIDKEYSLVHDNAQLQDEIKKSFSNLGIKKPDSLEDLIKLSDKYSKLKFWNSSIISSGEINDSLNDIFRYPESKVDFILSTDSLCMITEKNQQELEEDIELLHRLFLKLHTETTYAKIRKEKSGNH